jgi:hypothetical protein
MAVSLSVNVRNGAGAATTTSVAMVGNPPPAGILLRSLTSSHCGPGPATRLRAGPDGAGARHRRQRQARRLCRAGPAGRSEQGQAHPGRLLCEHTEPGRRGTVNVFGGKGAVVRLGPNPPPPHWPRSTMSRCRASNRPAAFTVGHAEVLRLCRSPLPDRQQQAPRLSSRPTLSSLVRSQPGACRLRDLEETNQKPVWKK